MLSSRRIDRALSWPVGESSRKHGAHSPPLGGTTRSLASTCTPLVRSGGEVPWERGCLAPRARLDVPEAGGAKEMADDRLEATREDRQRRAVRAACLQAMDGWTGERMVGPPSTVAWHAPRALHASAKRTKPGASAAPLACSAHEHTVRALKPERCRVDRWTGGRVDGRAGRMDGWTGGRTGDGWVDLERHQSIGERAAQCTQRRVSSLTRLCIRRRWRLRPRR